MVDKDLIKDMYLRQHMTTTAIAEALNLKSASTVNYHLKRMGIPMRALGPVPSDKTTLNTQLQELFAQGLSDADIGSKLDLAPESIRKYRNRARILRPRGGLQKPFIPTGQTAEVVALRAQGWSLPKISDHLQVSLGAVSGALQRAAASKEPRVVDHAVWAQAYTSGLSLAKVALKYGTTAPSVLAALRKLGIETRKVERPAHKCSHALKRHQTRSDGWCPSCWRRNNRDIVASYFHARRARKCEAAGAHSTADWVLIKAAYDSRCAYCGDQSKRLTRDHIVPLSRGGTDGFENIVPACGSCNSKKHASLSWKPMTPDEVWEKFGVKT